MNQVNLGSIVIVNSDERSHYVNGVMSKNVICHFEGLSTDFSKLQTASSTDVFSKLATGSDCLLYDTSQVYKYCASDKTWYEI